MLKRLGLSLMIVMFLVVTGVAQQREHSNAKPTEQEGRGPAVKSEPLKVGDVAPAWELVGTDGKTYRLADFKGKKGVIVAWYPAALTGG